FYARQALVRKAGLIIVICLIEKNIAENIILKIKKKL
ncbi:hypothetical protein LCGC14_2502580, partial [marine sediment metagenome]